jgi:hypothetical protein
MKYILFLSLLCSHPLFSQSIKDLNNVVVVAQFDKLDDRFQMELAVVELLTEAGIKALPSMNFLKTGANSNLLGSDSIMNVLKAKGFTKIMLVSCRGFDTKFKGAKKQNDLNTELGIGHLFPIYRDESTSVTFEFRVFEGNTFIQYGIQKIAAISSRDGVMKKFKKKIRKTIRRRWS